MGFNDGPCSPVRCCSHCSRSPETGLTELHGSGYAGTEMRLPRKGGRVVLPFVGDPYDVCYLAIPRRRSVPSY